MKLDNSRLGPRIGSIGAAVLVALVALAGVAFGCSKGQAPTAESSKTGQTPKTELTPAVAPVAVGDKSGVEEPKADEAAGAADAEELKHAKASYAEASFDLALKPKGDYKAGQEGEAEIVLEPKAPFHANDKYPYKFKLADSAGVSFANKIVTKDKAKIEHMKVTMAVPFTAGEAGKKRIHGTFHFSLCTEDKCLIEKRSLALDVDVK